MILISKEIIDQLNEENNKVIDILTKYNAQLIKENSELRYKLNQISAIVSENH